MRALAAIGAATMIGACAAPPAAAPSVASATPTPRAEPAPSPVPTLPVAAARPIALANLDFEAPVPAGARCAPGWDCTVHNDPAAYRFVVQAGAAGASGNSLCVERVGNEPWALVTQAVQDGSLRGARVRLSMAVRVEGASGEGSGPWALVQGNPPVHVQRLARGTTGWERLAVELSVPQTNAVVEVGAMVSGPGRACFDDVRVERLPGG